MFIEYGLVSNTRVLVRSLSARLYESRDRASVSLAIIRSFHAIQRKFVGLFSLPIVVEGMVPRAAHLHQ